VAGISTQHQPVFPLQAKPSCGMAVIQFDFLIQPQRLSLSKFSRAHRDSLIALRFIMISSNEEYDSRLL
jgi:hypothetical protein